MSSAEKTPNDGPAYLRKRISKGFAHLSDRLDDHMEWAGDVEDRLTALEDRVAALVARHPDSAPKAGGGE